MHNANYLAALFLQSIHRRITLSGKLCRLGNVETTLYAIGQTIALLEPNHHDPHMQPNGKLIFVLKCQFWSNEKVEPIPIKLIKLAVETCCASSQDKGACIANMITIGFSFLCCAGEHTGTIDNKPLKLSNIQFWQDEKSVPTQSSKLLHVADFLTLTFDRQENSVKGKHIRHGCSTSVTLCPILAVTCWVTHLNSHKAVPHQPLCSYYHTDLRSIATLQPKTSPRYSVHHPYITCYSMSTQLLWSTTNYIPAVLWHFSLTGLMPYSSSVMATGIQM